MEGKEVITGQGVDLKTRVGERVWERKCLKDVHGDDAESLKAAWPHLEHGDNGPVIAAVMGSAIISSPPRCLVMVPDK